eukprot:21003-Pyramimonas_sp.AAC.1
MAAWSPSWVRTANRDKVHYVMRKTVYKGSSAPTAQLVKYRIEDWWLKWYRVGVVVLVAGGLGSAGLEGARVLWLAARVPWLGARIPYRGLDGAGLNSRVGTTKPFSLV